MIRKRLPPKASFALRYPPQAHATKIRIESGCLDDLGSFVRRLTDTSDAALVSDTRVAPLYARRAIRALRRARIHGRLITVPAGERSKCPAVLEKLWIDLERTGLQRRGVVVALGGGVVGDLAGFAAATWLRGVPWICVPTSVVAQVDSAIGGKTGVDLGAGKNLVGAFHQPAGVLVDPGTLATLPDRHRRAGLAEVVKMGMAVDAKLFAWLERHAAALAAGDTGIIGAAVVRSIRTKAGIVVADEREREGGKRSALNFGHTAGHAIEATLGYRRLLHGEAVAIGMRVAASLSEREAGLRAESRQRLEHLLVRFGLPSRMPPLRVATLIEAMRRDKKRAGRGVRWVLTPRTGHASVPRPISGGAVRLALLEAGARI